MTQKRIYEGNEVVFDARNVLDARKNKGKVLIKMHRGPLSFTTAEGVRFWKEHPYQWVSGGEATTLLGLNDSSKEFKAATKEQVEDHYCD